MMLDIQKLRSIPTLYPSTNWIVAHVYSDNYDEMCERIEKAFGHYCPVRSTVIPHWVSPESRTEGEVLSIAPIFPGYVFIDITDPNRNWTGFDEIDGVLRILTNADSKEKAPHLLTPQEVMHIISLTSSSLSFINPEKHSLLGCQVTIIDGVLKNLSGTVVEDGNTVKIELNVAKKVLQVRIDRNKVAKRQEPDAQTGREREVL